MKSCFAGFHPNKFGWNLQRAASDEIKSASPIPELAGFHHEVDFIHESGFIPQEAGFMNPCLHQWLLQSVWVSCANLQSRHGVPLMRGFNRCSFSRKRQGRSLGISLVFFLAEGVKRKLNAGSPTLDNLKLVEFDPPEWYTNKYLVLIFCIRLTKRKKHGIIILLNQLNT